MKFSELLEEYLRLHDIDNDPNKSDCEPISRRYDRRDSMQSILKQMDEMIAAAQEVK